MLVEALCTYREASLSPLSQRGCHLDPRVGAQQVEVVVSRVHGSAVLLTAGEAAKAILDPGAVSDDCRIGIRNSYPSGLREWCRTTPGMLGLSLSGVTAQSVT